jgi:glycosyltransferase involved in cell wall biosynthesis
VNKQRKKICLITTNHISTNPRLVKEAISLEKYGFDVHIVFTQFDQYSTELDYAILASHPTWKYDALNWSGKNIKSKIYRFGFGLFKKISEKLALHFFSEASYILILNRNFYWQLKKALKVKADIFIAHNLGALPVAKYAAKKLQVKCGFDAEDFHRHEIKDDSSERDVIVKKKIEEIFIPGLDHFTAASPLIGAAYKKYFPGISPVVVLNVFPKINPTLLNENQNNKLKLFWFSQTIGENRGIEEIIHAMGKCKLCDCELHLLGKVMKGYNKVIEELAAKSSLDMKSFVFHGTVPEKEIFTIASTCDIGMATETGYPHNRNICLTNKIFTYIQSGLAVIASDTKAQCELIQQYPSIGKIYKRKSLQSLVEVLENYAMNRDELEKCKDNNFRLGQTELNWENEQEKFISSICQSVELSKVETNIQ